MTDRTVEVATADALLWQAEARTRLTDPATADDLDRARLDQLCQTCPPARVAAAVLGAG